FAVSAFRAEAARAGAARVARALVKDLSAESPDFAAMWRDNDVQNFGDGRRYLDHPVAGRLALEYSAFAVDGRPGLGMMVYRPATQADMDTIRALLTSGT